MHSGLVITLSLLACASAALGARLPESVLLGLVTAGVSLVGVPHGSLDHIAGRRLLQPLMGGYWPVVFFVGYGLVAGLIVVLWLAHPLSGLLVFFALSAWHFGVEDDGPRGLLESVAVGSLLITIPACTQPSRLTELLGFLFPAAAAFDNAATAVLACQAAGWVLLPVVICSVLRNCRTEPIGAVRTVAFALMFALADPLLSFAIYFCVWHSIRGLQDLSRQFGDNPVAFVFRLLPISILTLCCAALAWQYLALASDMPTATMRTVFVGLSAIATPHLLLHSLVDCRQGVETRLFMKTPGLAS